jgi:hypothetical protein
LDDLPIDDIQKLATDAGLESWFDLYLQPARYGAATVALYRHCCGVVGDTPVDPVTPKVILNAFEPVDDDLPTLFEEGLPDPEADGPTTA